MSEIEPITREEALLNSIAEGTDSEIYPITRKEMYLSAIAGETELPADMNPITREEIFLQKVLDNGTGGGSGDEPTGTKNISITENGTTTHNIKAYASAQITANVPNSYSASDEGKVVDNGDLVSQTSKNVTENGTVDTTLNNSVVVNVPQGITPTGTKEISITQNDTTTEDVTNYAFAQITVNVPTGGGGATLINEVAISASNNVQINMDSTWFNTYDIIYIEITGTASANDWIYYGFDTTSPQAYSNKSTTVNVKSIAYAFGNTFAAMVSGDRQSATKNNPEYLYAKLYSSSNTMTGSYKIYGITV